jgi:hypothetical protein
MTEREIHMLLSKDMPNFQILTRMFKRDFAGRKQITSRIKIHTKLARQINEYDSPKLPGRLFESFKIKAVVPSSGSNLGCQFNKISDGTI